MEKIILSIIITSYNEKELLKKCLDSVSENIKGMKYEIIVVDNASIDGSTKTLRSEFPQVKLIANDINVGFAKANNQGAEIASGEYILLLNSDAFLQKGELGEAIKYFEMNESIGAIGGKVLNPDGSLQYSCFRFPSFIYEYLRFTFWMIKFIPNSIYRYSRMTDWNHENIRIVDIVAGCFLLTKKTIIKESGLFDENFFMSYEDADLCYNLKKHGFKVVYFPFVEATHYLGVGREKDMICSTRHSFNSMIYYFRKNKSKAKAFLIKLCIYITWIIFYLIFSAVSIFIKNDKIEKKRDIFKNLCRAEIK